MDQLLMFGVAAAFWENFLLRNHSFRFGDNYTN